MAQFDTGKIIKTVDGMPVTIVRYIAGEGQGDVYEVEYKGRRKALLPKAFSDLKQLPKRLRILLAA